MICNNVLIRILCESVPFHYIMDHAEIRARAHKRRLEVYGGSFYLSDCVPKMWEHLLRSLGARGMRDNAEGSGFTHRGFILLEVVPVTRPDAGAQPYNLGWVREL